MPTTYTNYTNLRIRQFEIKNDQFQIVGALQDKMFNRFRYITFRAISSRVFANNFKIKIQSTFSESKPSGYSFSPSVHSREF